MSTTVDRHAKLELFEIQPELILQFKKYRSLSPLQTGDSLPPINLTNDFYAWQHFNNGAETGNYLSTRQLLSKPLVISFYSDHWKNEGFEFIKQLNELNPEIKANGGNMVVVTDARNAALEKLAWENNLTLHFYFDKTNRLAESFGIYDKKSPVWERFSGIDAHVPLLASFMLTPHRQIAFAYTNWDMEVNFNTELLIQEVYQSGLYLNTQRSA